MDIEKLVQMHKDLTNLQMAFAVGGLPESIKVEDLKAITEAQTVIERMVREMKKMVVLRSIPI